MRLPRCARATGPIRRRRILADAFDSSFRMCGMGTRSFEEAGQLASLSNSSTVRASSSVSRPGRRLRNASRAAVVPELVGAARVEARPELLAQLAIVG
jgi:hypothetical protein